MSQAIRARRAPHLLLVLFFALAALLAPTPALAATDADADTTVSWSVRPADTVQGSSRPNFAYEAQPGDALSDAIVVTNRSAGPIELAVYAADGFLTADGSLDILPGSETSTELGSWTVVDTPQVSLESGQSAEIPFRVTVPAEALPGDYAAGVVAAMLVESDTGVVTERRLGSRMHLRVLGDLVPALGITDVGVDYHGTLTPFTAGSATVTYTLENTGNTRLDPAATVKIDGPFGWAPVTLDDDAPELLPGSSVTRTVEISGAVPLGLLVASVTATGEVVVSGLGDPTDVPPPVTAEGSSSTAAVPWTSLAVVLVVAGLVTWALLARRRARLAHQRAIEEAVAAARAETASELLGAGADRTP